MPWCPTCSKFLSPSTVRSDGTCPTCGRAVDAGSARAPIETEPVAGDAQPVTRQGEPVTKDSEGDTHPPIPWHLKLLVLALVIYLGFRAWQGIELLL